MPEIAPSPRLLPYLPEEPIEGDHVYVATFALGWQKVRELAGGDVRVDGAPPWLDAVAKSAITASDVPPNTLVAVAGFGPPAAEEVIRQLKATFGADWGPAPQLAALAPDGLLGFVRLKVGLEYEKPFELEKSEGLLFDGVRVKQFKCPRVSDGWWDTAKQVFIHHYGAPDDFVVELLGKSDVTRLLIARTPGRTGLSARVAHVLSRVGRERPGEPVGLQQSLLKKDTFAIPLVRVKEGRRFGEIEGHRLSGARDLGTIDAMAMDLELLLDERGVKLRSSWVVAAKGISPPTRPAYRIVCDGPFLVIVIRNGSAEPLAAAAIETSRWLIPVSQPDEVPLEEVPEPPGESFDEMWVRLGFDPALLK